MELNQLPNLISHSGNVHCKVIEMAFKDGSIERLENERNNYHQKSRERPHNEAHSNTPMPSNGWDKSMRT